MKVKAKVRILEANKVHEIGEVFEISEERAKMLGALVEVVEKEKKKSFEEPPKDKMVHKAKKK